MLFLFAIFFFFLNHVEADLTKEQENDIASFTTNFILEGNKRTDKNGYPLIAYMEGQARIDGYQSKLYKVGYDYNHINYINAYKWTFDSSSFASYIYYHTFNLVLTYSKLAEKDQYSGLTLRNPEANPYQISSFLEDAEKEEHFYYVKKDINGSSIDFKNVKKGDLIVKDNTNLMIYVGDEKVAGSTPNAINNSNLGFQIASLKDNYHDASLNIIRVKNDIIPKNMKANTKITWLDTNEVVELVKEKSKIEENIEISYIIPNKNWTQSLTINFSLNAVDELKSYSFSNGEDIWTDISGKSYNLSLKFEQNGTYYLKVRDSKDNEKIEKIIISSIDNNSPIINSLSAIQHGKYSVIEVEASDEESGLAENSFSFDNGKTWTAKNTFDVTVEKEYLVMVKDKAGNVSSMEIMVKIAEQSLPKIENIILGEESNLTKKVTIVVLNCNDCQIAIKGDKDTTVWNTVSNNTYEIYLKEGEYEVLLKDASNNASTQNFKVELKEKGNYNHKIIISMLFLTSIIVAILIIKKHKNNKI